MTSRAQRNVIVTLVALVLVILVINLIARGLDSAVGGSQPGGASGSSYATNGWRAVGLRAVARRLRPSGATATRQPRKQRARPERHADPHRFGATGAAPAGRARHHQDLPRPGRPRASWSSCACRTSQAITGIAPDVVGGVPDYHEFAPELGDLRTVRTDGVFAYAPHRDVTVLASQSNRALLVSTPANAGSVLLLAEATPLQNAAIGEADNAAFGLALPDPDQPVVFAEGVHGYGQRQGLAAIPDRWKAGLVLLGLAAILFAWSRARRLGPPDRPDRELPPARSLYVDAMADTLEHTQDRARALAPLGEWARNRIKVGAGLPPDADRDAVDRGGAAHGPVRSRDRDTVATAGRR